MHLHSAACPFRAGTDDRKNSGGDPLNVWAQEKFVAKHQQQVESRLARCFRIECAPARGFGVCAPRAPDPGFRGLGQKLFIERGHGRPGNGNRSLANMWDVSGDYQATRSISVGLYYGHAWGKSVIENLYPKNPNGQLAYLETNFRF